MLHFVCATRLAAAAARREAAGLNLESAQAGLMAAQAAKKSVKRVAETKRPAAGRAATKPESKKAAASKSAPVAAKAAAKSTKPKLPAKAAVKAATTAQEREKANLDLRIKQAKVKQREEDNLRRIAELYMACHSHDAIANSVVAGTLVKNLKFKSVVANNGAAPFGVISDGPVESVSIPGFTYSKNGPADQSLGDFHIVVV